MPELHFARYRNGNRFTHFLFRFPAKFHAPAVRCLIDNYSKPGSVILDPFCGSGTLLVEALVAGRSAIGLDVDPVAVFISKAKTTVVPAQQLKREFDRLLESLANIRRSDVEYDRLMIDDLDPSSLARFQKRLGIPAIPNIQHWFRVYVTLDLARLRNAIVGLDAEPAVRRFFLACFASIIRNASNADPVPVSGLEVTAHMKRLNAAGRRIDPFELFEQRVTRELNGMEELATAAKEASIRVVKGDVTSLARHLSPGAADVVITSPPYNTAVDYYRRHTLEMYWLGLVTSHEERLALAPKYLGRELVRVANHRLRVEFDSDYINRLIAHARGLSPKRERAVRHYCASMQQALKQISRTLKPKGRAVFVVGNSKWNGRRVRATKLISEIASSDFEVLETMSYSSRNRYMSYSRHNGADVDREFVLVLRKKS